jgi:membrane-bound lytic murein transglycosylase A
MSRMARSILALAAVAVWLAGCSTPAPPPPPPSLVLTPVGFDRLPGWRDDAQALALPALRRSCAQLVRLPPGQPIGRDGLGGLAEDWLAPCGALRDVGPSAAREFFEAWFRPFRATDGDKADGLFTGYCEAELKGARRASEHYRIPLYTRPTDLPRNPETVYLSRAEIEAGALAGKVPALAWLEDPVDAHVLQIQGSGRILMDDGTVLRVGYDGSNGRRFVALGRILVEHGKLAAADVTMPAVVAWLKAHPAEAPALMRENPRYVFFRPIEGDGPMGAAGVALTAGRSLAVDPRHVPFGAPVWLDTSDPDGHPLRRLMVAQDAGAAIQGPLRADIFWGVGPAAFDQAGRMKSRGVMYLLLPRRRTGLVAAAPAG